MEMEDFEMEIQILLLEEYAVNSHVMGYHDYINLWNPQTGRIYETRMEPENAKDRCGGIG